MGNNCAACKQTVLCKCTTKGPGECQASYHSCICDIYPNICRREKRKCITATTTSRYHSCEFRDCNIVTYGHNCVCRKYYSACRISVTCKERHSCICENGIENRECKASFHPSVVQELFKKHK